MPVYSSSFPSPPITKLQHPRKTCSPLNFFPSHLIPTLLPHLIKVFNSSLICGLLLVHLLSVTLIILSPCLHSPQFIQNYAGYFYVYYGKFTRIIPTLHDLHQLTIKFNSYFKISTHKIHSEDIWLINKQFDMKTNFSVNESVLMTIIVLNTLKIYILKKASVSPQNFFLEEEVRNMILIIKIMMLISI